MAISKGGCITRKRVGQFGDYYAVNVDNPDRAEMYFMTGIAPGVDSIDGGIAIPAYHLAAFCTELIHMARDLGVTGGEVQDGNN